MMNPHLQEGHIQVFHRDMCSIENVVSIIFSQQKEKKQKGAERLEEEKPNIEEMLSHFCNEEGLKGLAWMSAYSLSCCNTVSLEGKVTIGRNSYMILPFFKKKKRKEKSTPAQVAVRKPVASGQCESFILSDIIQSAFDKKKKRDQSVTLKQVTMVTVDVIYYQC